MFVRLSSLCVLLLAGSLVLALRLPPKRVKYQEGDIVRVRPNKLTPRGKVSILHNVLGTLD